MAKPAITKRTVKNAALTYQELDDNFQNIVDATLSLTADSGGTAVTADLNGNITLVAGTGVTITGDNTAKTITIDSTGGGATIDVNDIQIGDQTNTATTTISPDKQSKAFKLQGGLQTYGSTAGVSLTLGSSTSSNGQLSINNLNALRLDATDSSVGVSTSAPGGSGTTYYLRGYINLGGGNSQWFKIKLEPDFTTP